MVVVQGAVSFPVDMGAVSFPADGGRLCNLVNSVFCAMHDVTYTAERNTFIPVPMKVFTRTKSSNWSVTVLVLRMKID